MIDHYTEEVHPVPLAEAARIVGIEPATLAWFAALQAESELPQDYRLTVIDAPGGPFFVAEECAALAAFWDALGDQEGGNV